MSDTVLVALIGLAGTIVAALIIALSNRRGPLIQFPNPQSPESLPATIPTPRTEGGDADLDALNIGDATLNIDRDQGTPFPAGAKGRYILWLKPPLSSSPHYCHFFWDGQAFKVRDYIGGMLQQQAGATRQTQHGFSNVDDCSMTRDEVWQAAQARIRAVGELHHKNEDFEWWTKKLMQLTRDFPPE